MYFETHDYDFHDDPPATNENKITKNRLYLPGTNKIPLDLAFARWMAREHGITMMPNSFFYANNS